MHDLSGYPKDARIVESSPRQLVADCAGLPVDKVNAHIEAVRAKAFAVYPYPCIGMFRFLDLGLSNTENYDTVRERLSAGAKILDLGCCFGQELRKLVADGAPAENCYGADLRPDFIELGYELFRDKHRCKITFVDGDVFAPDFLADFNGKFDFIWTGSFFHLFPYEQQMEVARQVIRLLKPEAGAALMGRQVGTATHADVNAKDAVDEQMVKRHSPESWAEMWLEVSQSTGTKWEVSAKLSELKHASADPNVHAWSMEQHGTTRRLDYIVRRVS